MNSNTIHGNYYDKYRSSNPISRWLTDGFMKAWASLLPMDKPLEKVLEIGCGDGYLLNQTREILKSQHGKALLALGLEPGLDVLQEGSKQFTSIRLINGSIYDLPFPDNSVDLVVVPEVFEHLEDPGAGLAEVTRIARRYIMASVPWEPIWRIANMARGAYWNSLGNTPGHIQYFSRKGFIRFISRQAEILAVRSPFPWTMILARPLKTIRH